MPPEIPELPTPDPLSLLAIPGPSPTLSILHEAAPEKGDTFTIKHEPMKAPDLPPPPPKVRAGRRAHTLHTLTDFRHYIDHVSRDNPIRDEEGADVAPLPIVFYDSRSVECVLDERSPEQKEIITCDIQHHPRFKAWSDVDGHKFSHASWIDHLRRHSGTLVDENIIDLYASVSGTLMHDAEEHLDRQSRSASFVVRTKGRSGGGAAAAGEGERNVEDVPTRLLISVPILLDDASPRQFEIMVRMTGAAGAQVEFTPTILGRELIESEHVDKRLHELQSGWTGVLCVRGEFNEEEWEEPTMPICLKELMTAQTEMTKAMAARVNQPAVTR